MYAKSDGVEKIVSAIVVKNFDTYAYIVTMTKNGMLKKSAVADFKLQRYSKVAVAMKLKNDDELIAAKVAYANCDILAMSNLGYYNRYSLDIVNPIGTKSQGVKGINVKDDELASFVIVDDNSDNLLLMNDLGGFKRIKNEEIAMTSRATKGNRLFKLMKTKNINITSAWMVKPYDSLIVYNDELSHLDAKDVPFMSIDATFSNILDLKENYFMIEMRNHGIEDVEIIDFPADFNAKDENVEQLNLLG